MATYNFQRVLVWDVLPGGQLRTLRNGTVTVKNATTDATITTATSDQNGMVEFTTIDVPTVYLVSPSGLVSDHITAASAIEAAAGFTVSEDAAVAALVANDASSTDAALNARGDAINVKRGPYNAAGDGTTDDTAAIQSAINAAVAGPRRLFFPPGTYIVSGTTDMLTCSAGIEMFGAGATLKVKNSNGSWTSMFTTGANDASGLHIHGLTFDGNATNNQPVAGDFSGGNYTSAKRRIAVRADIGTGITVENCVFNDHDCTWVFVSSNSAEDVRILNNEFTKIGNLTDSGLVHDHSTVYIDGVGFEVAGNLFTSGVAGATTASISYGAISPIDTHGTSQKVHHNTIIGYVYGGQLSTSATFDNVGISWHHNTVLECGHGLHITPYSYGMRNVEIHDNQFELDYLTWKSHPWQNGGCGLSMNSGDGGAITNLTIRDNTFAFTQATHTGQSMIGSGVVSNGIQWVRREVGNTAVDKSIRITGNRIVGAPDNAIYARFSNIDGLDVTDNVIRDAVSTANADTTYSVAVYVDNYTSAQHTRIDRNRVRDTQKSGVSPYGNTATTLTAAFSLWSAAGVGVELAQGNTLEVAAGTFVKFVRELGKVRFDPAIIRTSADYLPEHAARTTLALTADQAYFVPIRLGPGAITQAACEITATAAGSTIEVAVYRDLNGRPGARLHSLGTIDSSLSSWRATTAGSYPLEGGIYWVGFAAHSGGPTITVATGRNSLINGAGFTGATSTDLTGIKSAGPHTSLPSTAPTASLTYGQGPLFYVVGA